MSDDRKSKPRFKDKSPAETSRQRDDRKAESRKPEKREGERIARRLARAGVASRRDAEAMVEAGRVSVNGRKLSSPAYNVGPQDLVLVDGEPLPAPERTRLFLFHKPAGTMTTNRDPEGRRTIFDVLPENLPRLMTVGRLDFNTEGLLLLTNDGGLARVLELPATGWLRRYRVRVHGEVDTDALEGLREGISVNGVFYGAIEASLDRKQGSNAWLTLALREGKNREVRNVLGALGLDVTRLIRISYGPFQLGELPEGELMEVRGRTLRDQLGPRLIEQAGADFQSEIRQPFSRKVETQEEKKSGPALRKAPVDREQALARLDTRPAGGRGKTGKMDTRDGPKAGKPLKARPAAAAPEEPRARKANVWHAPGSRPLGPSGLKKKKQTEGKPGRDGGTGRPRGGKNADRRR